MHFTKQKHVFIVDLYNNVNMFSFCKSFCVKKQQQKHVFVIMFCLSTIIHLSRTPLNEFSHNMHSLQQLENFIFHTN